eukprot:Colp12_sorted_trinity150504_noHs@14028
MKYTSLKDYPVLEQTFFVLLSYSAYLLPEAIGMSGIVSILFCGIVQQYYTYHNLSSVSKKNTKAFFGFLNFVCENFLFSYLGLSLFAGNQTWRPKFIACTIPILIVARMMNIFPLSFLLNLGRKQSKIPANFQMCMLWAGLRGAIAFALANADVRTESEQIIQTTTLIIVIVTVILFGGTTSSLINFLKIETGVHDHEEHEDDGHDHDADHASAVIREKPNAEGVDDALQTPFGEGHVDKVQSKWKEFDKKFVRPLLVKRKNSMKEGLIHDDHGHDDHDHTVEMSDMDLGTSHAYDDDFNPRAGSGHHAI